VLLAVVWPVFLAAKRIVPNAVRKLQAPLVIFSSLLILHGLRWVYQWTTAYIMCFVTMVTAAVLAARAGMKMSPRGRPIALTVVSILVIRLMLLENPVAWRCYERHLTHKDVGTRQRNAIHEERKRYYLRKAEVRYLAVGSSQTGAIYRHYRAVDPRLEILTLAAMNPFDLVQYRRHCASYAPVTILLYLSEFDIARPPAFNGSTTCPRQGLTGTPAYARLLVLPRWEGAGRFIGEGLAGEIFPEYKYGFIFRGLFEKFAFRLKLPGSLQETVKADTARTWEGGIDNGTAVRPRHRAKEDQIQRLIHNRWSEKGVVFNVFYLDMFLRFCSERGLAVAIVEGQYHPRGVTQDNRRLAALVKRELKHLAEKHKRVEYLDRSGIMEFTESDFTDGYHVNKEAGMAFAGRVVSLLDERQ